MARLARRSWLFVIAIAMTTLYAQSPSPLPAALPSPIPTDGEWHFARLVYADARGGFGRRGRGSFTTDYPEAEIHLRYGLERLTRVQIGDDTWIELDDFDIMNYPWLYAVEVGRWYLSDQDAALIREYLLRGGFLMVDDFWGTYQWQVFEESINRVFPDRPIVDIPDSDPLMSLIYEVDKSIQIPGRSYFSSGVTYQQDGYTPFWRGIYDDDGRLMVAINFNMDMGDAWEHANDPRYPQEMTTLAIRYAVNYVIYSMTH